MQKVLRVAVCQPLAFLVCSGLLGLGGCVVTSIRAPTASSHASMEEFLALASSSPARLWAGSVSEKVTQAVADFRNRKLLSSGKIYGESLRNFDFRNRCPSEIEAEMGKRGCLRSNDVLKNPLSHAPLLTKDGQTVPMTVFLCQDGGAVRLKPSGDPTSRFRLQPTVSQSLRYPFDSRFDSFDDEVVKVDTFGNAIPKWTKDLNPEITEAAEQSAWVQIWADDAHTDLRSDCR